MVGLLAISLLAFLAVLIRSYRYDVIDLQIPGVVVTERHTTLDLQGWKVTTPSDLAARVKKSKVVSVNHFVIRRTKANPPTFVHIMGTSSGIEPEFVNASALYAWVQPRLHDPTTRAPNEWAIHFDISSVPIGKSVPIDFSVTFWNAFQEPSQWWGGFRILHQTKRMLYEIKFPPDKHPRSDSILYVTKSDENDEQPFDESPVSTVTYDAEGKVEAIS